MRLNAQLEGTPIWHDCRTGFGGMLRRALADQPVIAAFGPIYETDPAGSLLEPFRRSARECQVELEEFDLAPDWCLIRCHQLRSAAIDPVRLVDCHDSLVDWARAGLVLEIARRRGISVTGRGLLRPNWKLRGTITGRFGCEPVKGEDTDGSLWFFNPLSLGPDDRRRIHPSDSARQIVVLDFRGMDVCSMLSIVPGLSDVYAGHSDPHQRTADLTGLSRSDAKQGFLSWAYGASFAAAPGIGEVFNRTFPMVREFTRGMQFGDFPRMVQMTSAVAFRAALSRALPLLVGERYFPMFAVHDELTVDSTNAGVYAISDLVDSLRTGASERIGVPYDVGVSIGCTYEEAKDAH